MALCCGRVIGSTHQPLVLLLAQVGPLPLHWIGHSDLFRPEMEFSRLHCVLCGLGKQFTGASPLAGELHFPTAPRDFNLFRQRGWDDELLRHCPFCLSFFLWLFLGPQRGPPEGHSRSQNLQKKVLLPGCVAGPAFIPHVAQDLLSRIVVRQTQERNDTL